MAHENSNSKHQKHDASKSADKKHGHVHGHHGQEKKSAHDEHKHDKSHAAHDHSKVGSCNCN